VLTPVQPATEAPAIEAPSIEAPSIEAKTHGRALGHVKQRGPAAPAPTDTTVVQALEPSPVDPAGPAQGHGSGHPNGRATPDGD
jgi:hypothetical protein